MTKQSTIKTTRPKTRTWMLADHLISHEQSDNGRHHYIQLSKRHKIHRTLMLKPEFPLIILDVSKTGVLIGIEVLL